MTTLHVVDQEPGECLTAAVARRLRGKLAEKRITGLELAKRSGMGRAMISRRLTGETALNTDELELIERTTGIPVEYLLTGVNPAQPPTPPTPTSPVDSLSERSSVQSRQGAPHVHVLRTAYEPVDDAPAAVVAAA